MRREGGDVQASGLEFLSLQLTILCRGHIEQWEAVVGRRAFDPRVAQPALAWNR